MNEMQVMVSAGLFGALGFIWFMCVLHMIHKELKRSNDMAAMRGWR